MTIQEASERYQIPLNILREYESWGLCGAVKKVMGAWQYDDTDLERLSVILTLHDIGFTGEEVETYMRLLLDSGDSGARSKSAGPRWTRSTFGSVSFNGWTICATRSERHNSNRKEEHNETTDCLSGRSAPVGRTDGLRRRSRPERDLSGVGNAADLFGSGRH